ncbi:MAG TPA: adenosine deaminase [Terriglobales bacterium]|nr:adenosine deaminase [Terriglobales bacterium]
MTAAERQQLRQIPKAELHLHLEGSLAPATLWQLSRRQGHPHGLDSLSACRRLYEFSNFAGFIHAIKTASQLLRDPADYAAAVTALAHSLQVQGIVYAEVFLSVGILLWRQVAVEPYWEAIESARRAAESETGVRIGWLFDAVRQFGAEPFERVLDWALQLAPGGSVLGIGIGGDESQHSASEFAEGYARARAGGLRTTIHAGETCGPESVWDALRHLSPDRIGHGLRAIEDPRLLEELARRGVPLDICPTSNYKTGALFAGQPHPAHDFLRRGVRLSISSDDPGIFGTSLLDEYAWLGEHGGFSSGELRALAQASLGAGFARRAPSLAAPQPGGDRGMGV